MSGKNHSGPLTFTREGNYTLRVTLYNGPAGSVKNQATLNVGPHPCPYTEMKNYFNENGGPQSQNLTSVIGERIAMWVEGRRRSDGVWETIPETNARNHFQQLTTEDGTYEPGYSDTFVPNPDQHTFSAGGTYKLTSEYRDNNSQTINQLGCTAVTANLTIIACPYQSTSVVIADVDNDPFGFFEELVDSSFGFCSQTSYPGTCSSSFPSFATHTKKQLRFKVMHKDRNGALITSAFDGKIVVKRHTSPIDSVTECTVTTDNTSGSGAGCVSGFGYADYTLDPEKVSLEALQSGGLTDDRYTVTATSIIAKNNIKKELSAPGCVDTDEIKVDACPYDSTQAYVKRYDFENWSSKSDGVNKYLANLNDTVQYASFHNYPVTNTGIPIPAFPQENETVSPSQTATIKMRLFGAFGLNYIVPSSGVPYQNPFSQKMELPGEYSLEAITNIKRNGIEYPLGNSEYCKAKTDILVGSKICKTMPVSVNATNCCPPIEKVSTPWSFQIPGTGISFGAPVELKIGITEFTSPVGTKKLADLNFGKNLEGVIDPGRFFSYLPPYMYTQYRTESQKISQRETEVNWNIGPSAGKIATQGPIEDIGSLANSVEFLRDRLVAKPRANVDQPISLLEKPLAYNTNNNFDKNVLGEAAPVCTEARQTAEIENVCFTDTPGTEIDAITAAKIFAGGEAGKAALKEVLKLNIDNLDLIGRYFAGVETEDTGDIDNAQRKDRKYEDGGIINYFLDPGEKPLGDKGSKGTVSIYLGVKAKVPPFDWLPQYRINLPNSSVSLRHFGAVENTEREIQQRIAFPGEVIPEDETDDNSIPTPPPVVTQPGEIPHTATGTVISEYRKQQIINFVKRRWPNSLIDTQFDYVASTAAAYGYNPAFMIALWVEESGASGVPAWDFGCTKAPKNNIPAGLSCMNGLSYKSAPWQEFSCRFSEGHYPCNYTINPNFPGNITRWYACVSQNSCSLF